MFKGHSGVYDHIYFNTYGDILTVVVSRHAVIPNQSLYDIG